LNGERSLLPAQRKEAQLKHIYVIYVQLYFNRAGIRPDYANYIFAKHKTDSALSYSHYTRFYALLRRVCTPTKTRGISSINKNNGRSASYRKRVMAVRRVGIWLRKMKFDIVLTFAA
jgi:hypothetical protein